ncbi:MAG: efflux RND transporter periplasmic adaptor subunit [Syntrophales bacterium]|nr:efflux RND transporter periplasmic adaptor subunit [Syntrophales bacterium]
MSKKGIVIGVILAVALGSGFYYRFTHLATGRGQEKAKKEAAEAAAQKGGEGPGLSAPKGGEPKTVSMAAEKQRQNGVIIAAAKKERLAGTISVTGKVEVNSDRIAHVSPRIPGKITSVRASLGDSVAAGRVLIMLDSVELGEAVNRYQQSKTRLSLMKKNMERVRILVEKKIAARKEILQAETEYQMTLTALHTDEERLLLYGLSRSDLDASPDKPRLLPVRAPIGGVITEKHAIVGELADPSKSLYTVADLSSVWVMVDINEKDLAKVRKGQTAVVIVGAFPDLKFPGRINHIADVMDDATRTVKARVEVQNTGRKLKPEMFATIELTLPADAPPVLVVPREAVQEMDGRKVLFVTGNGTEFTPRAVELGRASGGNVEVTGGLREGERYAVKGGFLLKSELKRGELGKE